MTLRQRSPLFAPDLREALQRIAERRLSGAVPPDALATALAGLGRLPAGAIARADREVASLAELYNASLPGMAKWWPWRSRTTDAELLTSCPGLEYLYIFHCDGRLREAALERIATGAPNPFFFAAITFRLNDWAAPVRAAARRCAERVFPLTEPHIIAQSAEYLLDRNQHWQRWGDNQQVLDQALARADVGAGLAAFLCRATTGPMAALLRHALRTPAMDRHLPALASGAFLPSVRATALQCLIEGRARWPDGQERLWIDKSMGRYRLVPSFAERPLACSGTLEDLIRHGGTDRAAGVRKVAATALVRHWETLPHLADLVDALAGDRCRAVREAAAFILRQRHSATRENPGATGT